MMDYAVVCVSALLAAALTLFSGFGLGTLLMPVFAIFFPVPAAIAMTAVVHLANNMFALAIIGKNASWRIVAMFTIPAVFAALVGAWLIGTISHVEPLMTYSLGSRMCQITLVKIVVALVIGTFAVLELAEVVSDKVRKPADAAGPRRGWITFGALLSGFFGGLTGHQGAIRSAFLVRSGLSKESFVATGKVSAIAIDLARLAIYAAAALTGAEWFKQISGGDLSRLGEHTRMVGGRSAWGLVGAACIAAFVGSFVGAKLVRKVTMSQVRVVVGVALMMFAAAMGAGIV